MQYSAEHNPKRGSGFLTNSPNGMRHEAGRASGEVGRRVLITTKGAGAKFGVDPHPRKRKTNTSKHFNDRKVQSPPGERRSLNGGRGEMLGCQIRKRSTMRTKISVTWRMGNADALVAASIIVKLSGAGWAVVFREPPCPLASPKEYRRCACPGWYLHQFCSDDIEV